MTSLAKQQINPHKLLLSKWTAIQPQNKEKHFMVTQVIKNEQEIIVTCILEAVLTHHEYELDWHGLKNVDCWLPGWH